MFKLMSVEDNLRIGSYLTRDSKLIAEGLSRVYQHFPILKEQRSQLAGELSGEAADGGHRARHDGTAEGHLDG